MLIPLESNMSFLSGRNNLVEIRDDVIALRLGNANDLRHETRVEEQRLPSSDRVRTDQRMLRDDGLTSDWTAQFTRALSLHLSGVQGSKTLQVLLHGL